MKYFWKYSKISRNSSKIYKNAKYMKYFWKYPEISRNLSNFYKNVIYKLSLENIVRF